VILHVDMDAFYASVEQLDDPELRGKCVIVGGKSNRGVVSAASYEARQCGIHSAMPIFQAKKLCPDAAFVQPRMVRYKQVSKKVMEILSQFSPLVEVVSIDEAYLDVTGCSRLHGPPVEIALKIKQTIKSRTGLNCSVGIAPLKFLAKIASDMDKPDGLTEITAAETADFINNLDINKVPGVGKITGKILAEMSIYKLGDVRQYSEKALTEKLGKFGRRLLELASARSDARVTPDTTVHSISTEATLAENTADRRLLESRLLSQAETVACQLRAKKFKARTVTLKVKHADFRLVTRRTTLDRPTHSGITLYRAASALLRDYRFTGDLRLIGVGASGLLPVGTPVQQDLFGSTAGVDKKWEKADRALDDIAKKFGKQSIQRGALMKEAKLK
jgi:DNA polymerase IV